MNSIIRPVPILLTNTTQNFVPTIHEDSQESSNSSRCTSNESSENASSSGGGKIRRGRPQQHIEDAQDAQSQKKRHRRMYARQYRAQMREKVDNVQSLKEDNEKLANQVKFLQSQLTVAQTCIQQQDAMLQLLYLSQRPANC